MTDSELPMGWRWAALADIAEVVMGQSPPSTSYRDNPDGLPFFQGKADFGLVHPTPRKWCVDPKKVANAGDILISVRAPVGPTNVADAECCIGRGLAAIRAMDEMDQGFLLHALKTVESEIVSQSTGTTFQAISGKLLRAVRIPVPPLDEQQRIVAQLEEQMATAERARAAAQAQLAAIEAMPQALLREIFPRSPADGLPVGWRWAKLGDVCEIVNGSTPKSSVSEYWGGGIPWITPADLGQLEGPAIVASSRTITDAGYASCSTVLVPRGSVILSSRAPIGHLGIAMIPLCTNQGCKSFVPKDGLDSAYLHHALTSAVDDIRALGAGATFPEVSKRTLSSFQIALAPIAEQRRIVADLEWQTAAVEDARAAAQAQLDALDALPAALLRLAFAP